VHKFRTSSRGEPLATFGERSFNVWVKAQSPVKAIPKAGRMLPGAAENLKFGPMEKKPFGILDAPKSLLPKIVKDSFVSGIPRDPRLAFRSFSYSTNPASGRMAEQDRFLSGYISCVNGLCSSALRAGFFPGICWRTQSG
jgi:hypothetical protein